MKNNLITDDLYIEEIRAKIRQHCIKIDPYTIRNGLIIVNGSVKFSPLRGSFEKLPLLFGEVSGDFDCSRLKLKSLYGSPKIVGGNFNCCHNQLISLKYAPQKANTFIFDNNLKSLASGSINLRFNNVQFYYFSNNSINLHIKIRSNYKHIATILKYQNDYGIWSNQNETLIEDKFDELIVDILDGLE